PVVCGPPPLQPTAPDATPPTRSTALERDLMRPTSPISLPPPRPSRIDRSRKRLVSLRPRRADSFRSSHSPSPTAHQFHDAIGTATRRPPSVEDARRKPQRKPSCRRWYLPRRSVPDRVSASPKWPQLLPENGQKPLPPTPLHFPRRSRTPSPKGPRPPRSSVALPCGAARRPSLPSLRRAPRARRPPESEFQDVGRCPTRRAPTLCPPSPVEPAAA